MTSTQTPGQYDYTLTDAPAVTLGKTTYAVQIQTMTMTGRTEVHLTGPRGAGYFLRGFLGKDDGLRQVISWKSGAPLRVRGNEVRVVAVGDVIEVAR